MRTRMLSKVAVTVMLLAALACADPCYADAPKLGFAISVEGEGVLNPLVTRIFVTKVEKGSLAEAAGIVTGDEIVQIEGRPVVGKRARDLQSLMKINPGETRTLLLKHADGKHFKAKLTKPRK